MIYAIKKDEFGIAILLIQDGQDIPSEYSEIEHAEYKKHLKANSNTVKDNIQQSDTSNSKDKKKAAAIVKKAMTDTRQTATERKELATALYELLDLERYE